MLSDRTGPEGILMILPDRVQAESIADEVRAKGHDVIVRRLSNGRSHRRPPVGVAQGSGYSKTTVFLP